MSFLRKTRTTTTHTHGNNIIIIIIYIGTYIYRSHTRPLPLIKPNTWRTRAYYTRCLAYQRTLGSSLHASSVVILFELWKTAAEKYMILYTLGVSWTYNIIHTYTTYTAAAQPPAAIINHHFSGRPIVTRYVSGLINGRNKNRIKLLVRSIIIQYLGIYWQFSFIRSWCARVCVRIAGNCFYFAGALAPHRIYILLLYSIKLGFGAFIGIRARVSASARPHHPLAVGGDEVRIYIGTARHGLFIYFRHFSQRRRRRAD